MKLALTFPALLAVGLHELIWKNKVVMIRFCEALKRIEGDANLDGRV